MRKTAFSFEVRQRFHVRRDWDRIYEPGDERTITVLCMNDCEEAARRKIISGNFELGIQTLSIKVLE